MIKILNLSMRLAMRKLIPSSQFFIRGVCHLIFQKEETMNSKMLLNLFWLITKHGFFSLKPYFSIVCSI